MLRDTGNYAGIRLEFLPRWEILVQVSSGVEMKTSLLLMVLTMGMGAAGAVQATETTPVPSMPTEGRSLASSDASVDGHGVLSALSNLISSRDASGGSAPASEDGHGTASGDVSDYVDQPGPAIQDAGSPSRHGHHETSPSASASTAETGTGALSPETASPDDRSSLGWQSLLPGSIQ